MRTVVFDLDGTLVDTGADLVAAANACFAGLGHGDLLDPERDAATAFRGGRAMLRLGFGRLGIDDEAEMDSQYPLLLDHYARNILVHSRLYPGVATAVDRLRQSGVAVAICTNKPEALAETLMTKLGARHWFDALVGADTLPVRKPDPAPYFEAVMRAGGDPKRSILVGDTETDRETARAARVPSVLITFGPEGRDVGRLEPQAMLDRYDDLPRLVDALIP